MLAVPLQVQQERDMLQSGRRAGPPSRGDAVQPFEGHPANGPDGGNVVYMHPQHSSLQMTVMYSHACMLRKRHLE